MKKRILSLVLCAAMLLSMCLFMGAGGGAAAVRAQIEIMIPQKFPACALGRRESENSVLRNILSGRKVVCA